MKLAISLVALFAVLGEALGETDPCLTSCTQVKVFGFSGSYSIYNGLYTPKENTKAGQKPTIYVNQHRSDERYEIYYDKATLKYSVQYVEDGKAPEVKLTGKNREDYKCLEDQDAVWFKVPGSLVSQIARFECATPPATNPPTTTNSPCKPCRKVMDADSTLNGFYKLKDTGDSRCTMDGCLYEKVGTKDMYCFEKGSYTVEDLCPTPP